MRISDWSSDVCSSDLLQTVSADLTVVSMAALGLSVDLRSVVASGGRVLAAGFFSVVALILLAVATAFVLGSQIGSASRRERVCQYVAIPVGAESFNKKQRMYTMPS